MCSWRAVLFSTWEKLNTCQIAKKFTFHFNTMFNSNEPEHCVHFRLVLLLQTHRTSATHVRQTFLYTVEKRSGL